MPSSCIYEVFQWMGKVMKFTGSIPLPGLYENNKTGNGLFLRILLPLLFFLNCAFAFFDAIYMGMNRNMEGNLTDILSFLILIIYAVSILFFPPLFHFRLSGKLVAYFKLHAKIDQLIKPHRNGLKLMFNILVVFWISSNSVNSFLYAYVRFSSRYEGEYAVYEACSLLNYLYLSACFSHQPQIMYLAFQYVLKCAFQELLKRIQEGKKTKSGSVEDAREKLRMYGTLYRSLCQLGKLLDDMTSPMIAHLFLYSFMVTINSLTFSAFVMGLDLLALAVEFLLSATVMVFIPMAAQGTENAASKIVSSAFSSFDLNDKEIAKEMHIFSAQLFQNKVEFSASGLFKLDRKLIVMIIQSIIQQWVVFYKIQKNID